MLGVLMQAPCYSLYWQVWRALLAGARHQMVAAEAAASQGCWDESRHDSSKFLNLEFPWHTGSIS